MNDDHTFAPEMTAEEAIQMVLKRPEMYGLQKGPAGPVAGEPLTDDLAKLHGIIEQFRARGIKYKAERDAALAAVERVRSIHQKRGASWPHNGGVYVCGADNGMWPCPTVAALDGAPEPDNYDQCDAEVYSWDHYRPEQIDSYWIRCTMPGKHDEHEDSHTGLKWRSGLPVEGESK